MQQRIGRVMAEMIAYEAGCPQRIHHFLKVYAFAKAIASAEGLDEQTQHTLEVAALLHDIGIRPSLEKYASSAGPYQEQEGPAPARALLAPLGYEEARIARVCYLIAHHHTYTDIDGIDYQILIEADFLVNALEEGMSREAARRVYDQYIRTQAGRRFFAQLFLTQ
nr:HD domain-containing protein [Maliibacterium massiliense]